MGPEANLPPKVLTRDVQRYAKELARRRADMQEGTSDAESLPVLEAFQQFLDSERRRSRNRVLAVAGLCIFLLVIAAGGMLVTGALMLDDIGGNVELLRQRLELVGSAAADQLKETETSLASLRRDFESLRAEVTEGDAAPVVPRDPEAAFSNVLAGFQMELSAMVTENLELRSEMDGLRSAWSNRLVVESRGVASPAAVERESPGPALPPVAAVPNQGQRVRQPLALSIRPPDEPRAVRWLVPIPE